ncbi:MAG TPA: TPM domain-containing protein [Candidatus Eremiobacteraceae bacterium]|nr:TPM domain-containing protein [Candidatus Eremiobacteraceae bacterium]
MVKRMVHRGLARHVDTAAIEAAIAAAELRTSGQIRVSLAPNFWGDVRRTAERAFERMGMTATPHRNAVLFFVVPGRRKFVVLGDAGIHEMVGQDFWESVTAAVAGRFRQGDLTGGLIHGIQTVGEQLARYFPYEPGSGPGLPNAVDQP